MSKRKVSIETGFIYHVYNRGVAKMPTFTDKHEYERAIALMSYYRYANTPMRYSYLLELPAKQQKEIISSLKKKNDIRVRIHTFTLMPNHFHFCLEQLIDRGISSFVADFTNSYTKFVNTRKDRVGPLFQGPFKAVLVQSEEQLLHLSRYQHLNIYTGGIVNTAEELLSYPYSSLPDYIGEQMHDFIDTNLILSHFKSKYLYKKFVLSHRDYQRSLGMIKKLIHEKPSTFRA